MVRVTVGTRTIRVGRDRVEVRGDSATVFTPVQMDGWEVRRYRASVIRFDGRTWRVTRQTTSPDRLIRYDLTAWEPRHEELTGPEIEYSQDDVELRDQALSTGRRQGRIVLAVNAVGPLTGFLPARMKDRLETAYGIDPVASTTASIIFQVAATLGLLALSSIATMVKVYGFDSGIPIKLALVAAVVAAVDAVVRWSQVLGEVRPPAGFYEWLGRSRRSSSRS